MCTVRVPPKTKQSNKNFFEIIQAGKKKPLQLQAETIEERDAWVKAIQVNNELSHQIPLISYSLFLT